MNRNRNVALSFVFAGLPVCCFFLFSSSFLFAFSPLQMKIGMELSVIFSLIFFALSILQRRELFPFQNTALQSFYPPSFFSLSTCLHLLILTFFYTHLSIYPFYSIYSSSFFIFLSLYFSLLFGSLSLFIFFLLILFCLFIRHSFCFIFLQGKGIREDRGRESRICIFEKEKGKWGRL